MKPSYKKILVAALAVMVLVGGGMWLRYSSGSSGIAAAKPDGKGPGSAPRR